MVVFIPTIWLTRAAGAPAGPAGTRTSTGKRWPPSSGTGGGRGSISRLTRARLPPVPGSGVGAGPAAAAIIWGARRPAPARPGAWAPWWSSATAVERVHHPGRAPAPPRSRLLRAISKGSAGVVRHVVHHLETYEAKDRLMSLVGPFAMLLMFVVWLCRPGGRLRADGLVGERRDPAPSHGGLRIVGVHLGLRHRSPTDRRRYRADRRGHRAPGHGAGDRLPPHAVLGLLGPRSRGDPPRPPGPGSRPGAPRSWPGTTGSGPPASCRTSTGDWERWAAAVAESHTNYPSLMWFRSPVPWRSWLTALTAMLDAAALHDAINPGSAPRQARTCLQMGTNMPAGVGRRAPHRLRPRPDCRRPRSASPTRSTRSGCSDCNRWASPSSARRRRPGATSRGGGSTTSRSSTRLTKLVMPPPAPWFVDRPWLGEIRRPRVLDRTPDDPQAEAKENR